MDEGLSSGISSEPSFRARFSRAFRRARRIAIAVWLLALVIVPFRMETFGLQAAIVLVGFVFVYLALAVVGTAIYAATEGWRKSLIGRWASNWLIMLGMSIPCVLAVKFAYMRDAEVTWPKLVLVLVITVTVLTPFYTSIFNTVKDI